jgi:hypothetical protein
MKKFYCLLILFTNVWLVGCDTDKARPPTSEGLSIIKIKITNYTDNEHIKTDTTITDQSDIAEFAEQIHAFKEVHDLNVKSSFGFYDVIIYYSDGSKTDYGVIYTVFDGVVIYNYNTNRMFKNNEIYNLMLKYLAMM